SPSLGRRQGGVVDRVSSLARQVREQRRAPCVLEAFLSGQPEARRAVLVEERVARQLALPVTNAIAGLLELRGVAERVDGVHRLHEREGAVERHLHLEDRKSTRLNSSHVKISYAVFASKKKTT